ncbi:LysR substrate-binding domain-containing protein [Devosia aurantiaca]|uniref:LysR substrate-binding domain-containing protein n=1 Tax=Devosia aurantiaca TaxID=2714858 RepID=A0A6M1SMH5_9HYPH|nr:LysR substrate-binding domain-containing protein [Devosia aurantiaca]NGP16505.1 hypothetical protein [Devosia aurantiaca]
MPSEEANGITTRSPTLIVDTSDPIASILGAALDGIGLGYIPQTLAAPHLRDGSLFEVLGEWCPLFDGEYLYYPSRKQNSPAFTAFVEALRYDGPRVFTL